MHRIVTRSPVLLHTQCELCNPKSAAFTRKEKHGMIIIIVEVE